MARAKLIRRTIVVALLLWLIISALLLGAAASDAKRSRDAILAFSESMTTEQLQSGTADLQLRRASVLLQRSHDRLHNPVVRPLQWLPVVGRQLRSADALTGAGATITRVGLDSLQDARALSEGIKSDRAGTLDTLGDIATKADTELKDVKLGPDEALFTPLADARNEMSTQLANIRTVLGRSAAGAKGVSQLFSTDGKYLVIAANNAEMRAGSGMFLSAGTLRTGGGNVTLDEMKTVGDTLTVPDAAVAWPADMQKLWGFMGKQADIRNLMLSPRFDQSAPLATKIWERAGNGPVDGVLVIDPSLLQALLKATGPIDVGDRKVTAESVITELLVDQYRTVSTTGSTVASQSARREGLSAVAEGAFEALNLGKWDPIVMVRELAKAADARHMMLWSKDPAANDRWIAAGVGGVLGPDSLMLNINNVGANKLDSFLQVSAEAAEVTGPSGLEMSVKVTVKNNVPTGAPRYVLGPTPGTGLVAGEYQGILALSLPGDSTAVRFDGDVPTVVFGPDGPTQVIGGNIQIKRGETKTYVVRFTRASTARRTNVEPSARLPATKWTYKDESWADDKVYVLRH